MDSPSCVFCGGPTTIQGVTCQWVCCEADGCNASGPTRDTDKEAAAAWCSAGTRRSDATRIIEGTLAEPPDPRVFELVKAMLRGGYQPLPAPGLAAVARQILEDIADE